MTTFANRQRDRATHLSLVNEEDKRALVREEAARVLAERSPIWVDTEPATPVSQHGVSPYWPRCSERTPSAQAWNNAFPACTGPCHQGRNHCPTPAACMIDVEDAQRNDVSLPRALAEWLEVPPGIVVALAIVGGIACAVLGLHWALT